MRVYPALVLCVAAVGIAASGAGLTARDAATRFEFAEPHMGTTARVVLYAVTETEARELATRAFARIAELDSRLSDYRPDTELMALCRAAGGPPVSVSEDLYTVLSSAQRISERTDGAFDVTVGPISRIWRRARATGQPPDAATLATARAFVGYGQIELLSGRTVRLAKVGMLLDLGGIAKGYAAGEAVKTLRALGAPHVLVAIGGDIVAGDAPPGARGWRIAIAPLGPAVRSNIAPLMLRAAAVSTSGDAEQHVEHQGTRYSHILTPLTGRAVEGQRGVSVRADDGLVADALATALSVLGYQRGLSLIDDSPSAAALIVDRSPAGIREYRSARW